MNQQSKITANSKNRASDLTGERTGVQGVEPRKASPPRTPRRTRKVTTLDMPTKDKVLDTETKKMVQYVSSIVNLSTGKRYRCWWCTLTIDNEPIGCPIGVKFSYPDNDPQATEGGASDLRSPAGFARPPRSPLRNHYILDRRGLLFLQLRQSLHQREGACERDVQEQQCPPCSYGLRHERTHRARVH